MGIFLLVTVMFWIKGGQLDTPVRDVTFFGSKEVSWDPASLVFQGGFMVYHFFLGSMVFQGGLMVFHCLWLVSMIFQGGFMIFHGPWLVYMVFKVFGWFPWFFKVVSWFFMVFGWFPWFFKVFSWFFIGFSLVSMVLLVENTPQNCILAQQSSLGLAGRRPALA